MDPVDLTLVLLLVVALAAVLISVIRLMQPTTPGSPVSADVVERAYSGEVNATGVGPVFAGNGPGIAVTSVHQDERWNLVIDSAERGIESVQVNKALWARADKGTRVTVTPLIGRWFGGEVAVVVALR
jgi:hypothetical protein